MKIFYVAKHHSGGNEDEASIWCALSALGHSVTRVQEDQMCEEHLPLLKDYDFVLYHHWRDYSLAGRIGIPKVFWYFDLVDFADRTLARRNQQRIYWMGKMTEICTLGFCTDGDWARRGTGKLEVLRQGADSRILRPPTQMELQKHYHPNLILFTGISRGGRGREEFVSHMKGKYGIRFCHYEKGIYRLDLADKLAEIPIVVAPDSPVTDRYWSNRVYNTIGLGGFLIHPYCEELSKEFRSDQEIVFYRNKKELDEKIDRYLKDPKARYQIALSGYQRIKAEHTYKHRCEKLIDILKERKIVS